MFTRILVWIARVILSGVLSAYLTSCSTLGVPGGEFTDATAEAQITSVGTQAAPLFVPASDDAVISVNNASSLIPSQEVVFPGANDLVWVSDGTSVALIGDSEVLLLPTTGQVVSGRSVEAQASVVIPSETPSLLVAAKRAPVVAWVSGKTRINHITTLGISSPITTLEAESPITGLAMSPAGDKLAYATFKGDVTTQPLGTNNNPQTWRSPTWLANLVYSADGRQLTGVDLAGFTIYFSDSSSGEILKTLVWSDSVTPGLTGADLSPDWRQIAWVTQSVVQLMSVDDGNLGPTLSHQYVVSDIAWSLDSRLLATTSAVLVNDELEPAVMIWDPKSGSLLNSLIQPAPVQSIAFSPDGYMLAVLNSDGNLRTWSVGR